MKWNPFKKRQPVVVAKADSRGGNFFASLGMAQGVNIDFRTKDYLGLVGASDYSNVWAAACTRVRGQDVASVNLRFYRSAKNEDDGPEELPKEHPLPQLFWGPNPFSTRSAFLQLMTNNLDLAGECFIILDRRKTNGQPQELWVLPPDRFTVLDDPNEFIVGYKYAASSTKSIVFNPDEVIFIKYPNPRDPYRGLPPLAAARLGLVSDYHAVVYNQNFFKQGGKPSMRLGIPNFDNMSDASVNRYRAQIQQFYAGADQAHQVMVTDKEAILDDFNSTQKDMEFIAQRKLTREEILATFNVPPFIVGLLEYANFANSHVQARKYWTGGIIPTLKVYEEAFNTFLCPLYGDDIYCEFDLSGVEALKENELQKNQIAKIQVDSDLKTVNEVRRDLWRLPPVLWGDEQPSASKAQGRFPGLPGEGAKSSRARITKGYESEADEVFDYWEQRYGERSEGDIEKGPYYEQQADFETKARKKEPGFEKFMHRFFSAQHERIWKRLKAAVESGKVKMSAGEARKILEREQEEREVKEYSRRVVTKGLGDIFDGEMELLGKNSAPIFADIMLGAGRESVSRWSLDIDFDASGPDVTKWLKKKRMKFGKDITSTTAKNIETAIAKLKDELGEGIRLGESMAKLEERVNGVFEFAGKVRSRRIAQTEVNTVSNKAANESYKQADAWGRGWTTANDEDVRDTHVAAGDRYAEGIPMKENFTVGAYEMEAPGDSSAGPEEICNCRCGTFPIMREPRN